MYSLLRAQEEDLERVKIDSIYIDNGLIENQNGHITLQASGSNQVKINSNMSLESHSMSNISEIQCDYINLNGNTIQSTGSQQLRLVSGSDSIYISPGLTNVGSIYGSSDTMYLRNAGPAGLHIKLDSCKLIMQDWPIDMGSQKIINLANGVDNGDAVNVSQFNAALNLKANLNGFTMTGSIDLNHNNLNNAQIIQSDTDHDISLISGLNRSIYLTSKNNLIINGFTDESTGVCIGRNTPWANSQSLSLENTAALNGLSLLQNTAGNWPLIYFNSYFDNYISTIAYRGDKWKVSNRPAYQMLQDMYNVNGRFKFRSASQYNSANWSNQGYDPLGAMIIRDQDWTTAYEIDHTGTMYNNTLMPINTTKTIGINNVATTWGTAYFVSAISIVSQRSQKQNISELDPDNCLSFVLGCKPSKFQLISGTSGRYHYGFIADEVKSLAESLNYNINEFAPYTSQMNINSHNDPETGALIESEPILSETLRYEELNMFLYGAIKKLNNLIESLESRVTALEN
jgi:hypothetical protein